jgi:hypothetical protein
LLGAISFALTVTPGTYAARDFPVVCQASKLKATGKKVESLIACQASAAFGGTAIDPACVAATESKFSGSFSKLESRGGCATQGDAGDIGALVGTFADQISMALHPDPGPSRCSATKLTSAGRLASALLKVYAGERKGTGHKSLLQGDSRAISALCKTFGSAERGNACQTTDDQRAVLRLSRSFVASVVAELWPLAATGIHLDHPPGWEIDPADLRRGAIRLTNFGARYAEGGLIPGGGADIVVTSQAYQPPARLAEILLSDLCNRTIDASDSLAVGREPAARASFTTSHGEYLTEKAVAVYVSRRGSSSSVLYRFFLTYNAGDPLEADFLAAFQQVLASVQFGP